MVHPHAEPYLARPFTVVIVFGPPLLGRASLARALERQIPRAERHRIPHSGAPRERVRTSLALDRLPILEGDLATSRERSAALSVIRQLGGEPLFVAWFCDEGEARREVFHRYASLPARYAEKWWALWEADRVRREPLSGEIPPAALVGADARGSSMDHVVRVAASLGLPGAAPKASLPPVRRVLVVDDQEDERRILGESLEMFGCRVFYAASADEALDVVENEALDLVVTDQSMPGKTGIDLAEEIARDRPDLRTVLLTGHAEEIVESALGTPGVVLLLGKPARMADWVRVLEEQLD